MLLYANTVWGFAFCWSEKTTGACSFVMSNSNRWSASGISSGSIPVDVHLHRDGSDVTRLERSRRITSSIFKLYVSLTETTLEDAVAAL